MIISHFQQGGTNALDNTFVVSKKMNEEISLSDQIISADIEIPDGYIPFCANYILYTVEDYHGETRPGYAVWDIDNFTQAPYIQHTLKAISISDNLVKLSYRLYGENDGYRFGYFTVVFFKNT